MSTGVDFTVEPLGPEHDRAAFRCGEPALDAYLRERAMQDLRRRIARVYVARGDHSGAVVGYYTLSAASFRRDDLPADVAKRLPHYPVPAAILGRLAVDQHYQGQGIGGQLLLDAFGRVLAASRLLAVQAVIVEAISDDAKAFYERHGFQPFPDQPRRLYIPLARFERITPNTPSP